MKSFKQFLAEEIQASQAAAVPPEQMDPDFPSLSDPPNWWRPSSPDEMFDPDSWPGWFNPDLYDRGPDGNQPPPSRPEWDRWNPMPEEHMFDEDGDGVLSDEEREEYEYELENWKERLKDWEERWNDWVDRQERDARENPKPKPEKPQEPTPPLSYEEWQRQNPMPNMKDFDKNGDGSLDDTEQREYEQAWENWRQSYERWLQEVQRWRQQPGQENFGSPTRPTPDVVR